MGQMTQLDASLTRAQNAYEQATVKLHAIDHNLKINRIALRAARINLHKSQVALAHRLVVIYTSRDEQTTLSVLLGASSIQDLVNRIETVQSVSSQDVAVMNQVIGFKREVTIHRRALVREHRDKRGSCTSGPRRRRASARSSPGRGACTRRSRARSRTSSRRSMLGSSPSRGRRRPGSPRSRSGSCCRRTRTGSA